MKNKQPELPELYLLQCSALPIGKKLGKTTTWIHRRIFMMEGVQVFAQCEYQHFENGILSFTRDGVIEKICVDQVIICTGQQSVVNVDASKLQAKGIAVAVVGGAHDANDLNIGQSLHHAYAVCSRF